MVYHLVVQDAERRQEERALVAAADDGLVGKPITRTEAACASGGLALSNGVDAIKAEQDTQLAAGSSHSDSSIGNTTACI